VCRIYWHARWQKSRRVFAGTLMYYYSSGCAWTSVCHFYIVCNCHAWRGMAPNYHLNLRKKKYFFQHLILTILTVDLYKSQRGQLPMESMGWDCPQQKKNKIMRKIYRYKIARPCAHIDCHLTSRIQFGAYEYTSSTTVKITSWYQIHRWRGDKRMWKASY
jgi:hypothetical protein